MDAYGRALQGSHRARITLAYTYPSQYVVLVRCTDFEPGCFYGQSFGGSSFGSTAYVAGGTPSVPARGVTDLSRTYEAFVGAMGDALSKQAGLGGWTLSAHHNYDFTTKQLFKGDGTVVNAEAGSVGSAQAISCPPSNPCPYTLEDFPDGTLAKDVNFSTGFKPALLPDGSQVFISAIYYNGYPQRQAAFRIDPQGRLWRVTKLPLHDDFNLAGTLVLSPQGNVYLIAGFEQCIKKHVSGDTFVRHIGLCSTDATLGQEGFQDGSPTDTLRFIPAWGSLAFGPDESLYFFAPNRIAVPTGASVYQKIDPQGRGFVIRTKQSQQDKDAFGEFDPEQLTRNASPWAPLVGPDGSLYFMTTRDDCQGFRRQVRRIFPTGETVGLLGGLSKLGCSEQGWPGDGLQGKDISASAISQQLYAIALSPAGELHVSSMHGLLRIAADGRVYTAIPHRVTESYRQGTESLFTLDVPQAPWMSLNFAVGGSLVAGSYSGGLPFRSQARMPEYSLASVAVAEDDGRIVHEFDGAGRHLTTRDSFTGVTYARFEYDGYGQVARVVDRDGLALSLERDAQGRAVSVLAENGERTTLNYDAQGFLSAITDPANQATRFEVTAGGLMTRFVEPQGHEHLYGYVANRSKLARATRADGGEKTFVRSELSNGFRLTQTSPTGRIRTTTVRGSSEREIVDEIGGVTKISFLNQTQTFADGTVSQSNDSPEPRGLAGGRLPKDASIRLPSGLAMNASFTRTVTQSSGSIFEPTRIEDFLIVNGTRSMTSVFDRSSMTFTHTSGEGRERNTVLDSRGRVISSVAHVGQTAPTQNTFDARGRITKQVFGDLETTVGYTAFDRVESISNALNQTFRYEYDSAGRLKATLSPSRRRTEFGYDANGNMTSVRMPSGVVHSQVFTATNFMESYASPDSAKSDITQVFNKEDEMTRYTLSGSTRAVTLGRDNGGRLTGLVTSERSVDYTYSDSAMRVDNATSTRGAQSQSTRWNYNGPLVTSQSSSGAANGTFTYQYDARFRVSQWSLDGILISAVSYDSDGLVTQRGELSMSRTGPMGAPTTASMGPALWTYGYDSLGRIKSKSLSVAGRPTLSFELGYDRAGRIISRNEIQTDGATNALQFGYNVDNELERVDLNGVAVEQYRYDLNANRTQKGIGGTSENAMFDAKDRIISQGSVSYVFDEDGFLRQRGGDRFTYGTLGELFEARLSNGTVVNYSYDHMGRRVSKLINGKTTQYLYGNLNEPFQLTAVRDGSQLTSFEYDAFGHLVALQNAGNRYFVLTDQVGSPRVVVDADGNVIKKLAFSSFGESLIDSNPSFFLHIGFSGGINDKESNVVRFGFRDYEPATGRWLARDPILFSSGQTNLYIYVGNSPLLRVDPSGLSELVFKRSQGVIEIWPTSGMGPPERIRAHNKTINPNGNPWEPESNAPAPNGRFPMGPSRPTGQGPNSSLGKGRINFYPPASSDFPARDGLAVHPGRANKPFDQRETQGCIRVDDDGYDRILNDLPTHITIED